MKKEIVYTDKYALILSDEQIKDVRPHKGKFNLEQGLIINQFPTYLTDLTECKLIIAHLPLTDAPILDEVPLLPSFSWSQQDDVEKLAKEEYPIFDEDLLGIANNQQHSRIDFIKGYNKAKEKYKFTEEDLRVAIFTSALSSTDDLLKRCDEIIERLQQPSRPTHFECEMVRLSSNESFGLDYGSSNLKPKTITNSQGQVELVGKYI
jgi:hypothetical protein